MTVNQMRSEILKLYPGWKDVKSFSDKKVIAIWYSINNRHPKIDLTVSDGRYGGELYHQITIEEFLGGLK